MPEDYKDTGCSYYSSCLSCPFPRCLEEDMDKNERREILLSIQPRTRERGSDEEVKKRQDQIQELVEGGMSDTAVAKWLGMNLSTVKTVKRKLRELGRL